MTDIFKKAEITLQELEVEANRKQKEFWSKFHALESKKVEVDEELLKEWLEEYWLLYRNAENPDEWFVAVPKFLDFSIGWLDHTTKGYNIFVINKYTQWLGEMPDFLRKEVKIEPAKKITLSDDNLKFEEGTEEDIKDKFGQFLTSIGKGTARVKKGKEFDLLAQIIESGSLPFVPNPVDKADLREPQLNFKFDGKYQFQKEAYETFLKYGACGIYWMTGAGKSFLTMYVLDSLKGNKTLVVPTLTLIEQWKEYFKEYAPRLLEEVEIVTYQAYNKLKDKNNTIIVFDECHVLPADTFSKLATLKTKYRLGLSATPYREDKRTNYIFALTGYPLGLNWQSLMKILGKKYHDVNVYIVANLQQKINLASNLINPEKKTIIFVNLIDIGEQIANKVGIPFIHGQTKNRLELARTSKCFVASRVMELGISLKDLEHIIEVDFLFGSRREEVQRTGRLFHSDIGETHDIIMTKEEFEQYGKRLHGLIEKGFRINLKPMIAGSFKIIKQQQEKVRKKNGSNMDLVDELYEEGFFRTEKTFAEVCAELEKRGMTGVSVKRKDGSIFSKLNSLVSSKKLFKDKKGTKKVFVMR